MVIDEDVLILPLMIFFKDKDDIIASMRVDYLGTF